jgi:hypothetical protein
VLKIEGNCCGHVWLLFGDIISWIKRLCSLGVTSYLNFSKEEHILLLGEFVFAAVEFLKSQQEELLSNLCWKHLRGVERPEEL